MRDDSARLQDILNSINLIEVTLSNGRLVCDLSEIEFQGVLRCLEIIGEAAKAISKELKDENPNIPWRAISDMRNVLAHQYFEVDHEKIELVVHGSLEDLKSTVIKILGDDSNHFC